MRLLYWYDPHSVDQVKQLDTLRMLAEKESESIEVQGLIPPTILTSEVNFTPGSPASWLVGRRARRLCCAADETRSDSRSGKRNADGTGAPKPAKGAYKHGH